MMRIDSFYQKKPTLVELLTEVPALLDWDDTLPESIDETVLDNLIIRECGDLQTLAKDAAAFVIMFSAFCQSTAASWAKEAAALSAQYDPLHNYDRTDTEQETVEASGESSSSGNSEDSGSDIVTRDRQGFDSSDFVGTNKDTTAYGRVNDSSTSAETSGSSERNRELRSVGNIGVTTSQQMLISELELRRFWNIYEMILADFRSDLCIGVW